MLSKHETSHQSGTAGVVSCFYVWRIFYYTGYRQKVFLQSETCCDFSEDMPKETPYNKSHTCDPWLSVVLGQLTYIMRKTIIMLSLLKNMILFHSTFVVAVLTSLSQSLNQLLGFRNGYKPIYNLILLQWVKYPNKNI